MASAAARRPRMGLTKADIFMRPMCRLYGMASSFSVLIADLLDAGDPADDAKEYIPFSSTGFARSTRVARRGPLDSRSLWTRLRAASARPRCSRRSSIRIRGNRARNPAQARNRESAHGCGTVRAPLGPRPPRWPCGLARGRGPATPCRRDGPCERRGRV